MKPTQEQQQAVDLAVSGGSLKIEAYAGTGKTTTLLEISKALTGKRGVYLAFNRSIADDAQWKFPGHVDCRTAHSMAYRTVGYKFKDRLQRVTGKGVAELLRLPSEFTGMSGTAAGGMILDCVNRFTQSADTEFKSAHVPWHNLNGIRGSAAKLIGQALLVEARKLWMQMSDLGSSVPVTHDTYLKLWALSDPKINADFILFDEAQDANAVMMDLVRRQSAQVVWVGDRYQQIYTFRGAVNAMEQIKTDHSCKISQSFRFGEEIAELANSILEIHLGAKTDIKGTPSIKSRIEYHPNPETILCRTNAGVIDQIMKAVDDDQNVNVVGGVNELVSLLYGAHDLRSGRRAACPDLAVFKDWTELEEYAGTDTGKDMSLLVRLMNKHKVFDLIDILKKTQDVSEKNADVVVSTAHKSKGREWESVRLIDDFKAPDNETYELEDSNLLYVAVTRAICTLDVEECEVVQDVLQDKTNERPRSSGACMRG